MVSLPCELVFNILSCVSEDTEISAEIKKETFLTFRKANREFYRLSTIVFFQNALVYIKVDKLLCLYVHNLNIMEVLMQKSLLSLDLKSMILFFCMKNYGDEYVNEYSDMLNQLNRYYSPDFLIHLLQHLEFELFTSTLYYIFHYYYTEHNYQKEKPKINDIEFIGLFFKKLSLNSVHISITIDHFQSSFYEFLKNADFGLEFVSNIKSIKLAEYWFDIPYFIDLLKFTCYEKIEIIIGVLFVTLNNVIKARDLFQMVSNLKEIKIKMKHLTELQFEDYFVNIFNSIVSNNQNTLTKFELENFILKNNHFVIISKLLKPEIILKECEVTKDFIVESMKNIKFVDCSVT